MVENHSDLPIFYLEFAVDEERRYRPLIERIGIGGHGRFDLPDTVDTVRIIFSDAAAINGHAIVAAC